MIPTKLLAKRSSILKDHTPSSNRVYSSDAINVGSVVENQTKKKNHILISSEELYDKIQHLSRFEKKKKALRKIRTSNFLSLIKKIMYKNPIANMILNGERQNALLLRSGRRQDACSQHSHST